jgi:hypothetical protein
MWVKPMVKEQPIVIARGTGVENLYELKKQLAFKEWCKEIVSLNENDFIPRNILIHEFVRDGILPFLKHKGYILHTSIRCMCDEISSGMFLGNFDFRIRNIDNHEEDLAYWKYTISTDDWSGFFDRWETSIDDLDDVSLRTDIMYYIWDQLNLPDSPASKKLDDFLYDSDEDSDGYAVNDNDNPLGSKTKFYA